MDADEPDHHAHQRADIGGATRPIVVSLAWDIALNATIPVACYVLAKRFYSATELTALIIATVFPLIKSGVDFTRRRELDPVAVLVLLGLATSILAIFLGGDARVLLIRESFFTGAFGIACLVSLSFPRPIMFYFGRYFMAGQDPQKREIFDTQWASPVVRRAHRPRHCSVSLGRDNDRHSHLDILVRLPSSRSATLTGKFDQRAERESGSRAPSKTLDAARWMDEPGSKIVQCRRPAC